MLFICVFRDTAFDPDKRVMSQRGFLYNVDYTGSHYVENNMLSGAQW